MNEETVQRFADICERLTEAETRHREAMIAFMEAYRLLLEANKHLEPATPTGVSAGEGEET